MNNKVYDHSPSNPYLPLAWLTRPWMIWPWHSFPLSLPISFPCSFNSSLFHLCTLLCPTSEWPQLEYVPCLHWITPPVFWFLDFFLISPLESLCSPSQPRFTALCTSSIMTHDTLWLPRKVSVPLLDWTPSRQGLCFLHLSVPNT